MPGGGWPEEGIVSPGIGDPRRTEWVRDPAGVDVQALAADKDVELLDVFAVAKRLCQQREAVDEVVEHGVVWWPRKVGDRSMQADVAVPKIDASLEPWTMLGHLAARNRSLWSSHS
jgi:hypothetical protein